MSQEKLKILQMIEEKIISVDEGLRLLDSLEDEKGKENVLLVDQEKVVIKQENQKAQARQDKQKVQSKQEKQKVKTKINLGKGVDHEQFKDMNKPIDFEKLGKQINQTLGSSLGQLEGQLGNLENLGDMIEEKLTGLDKWGQAMDKRADKWSRKVDEKARKVDKKVNNQSGNWEKNIEKWATKLGNTIEKGVGGMQEELKKNQVKKTYHIKTEGRPIENITLIDVEVRSGDVEIFTEDRDDICIEALGYGGEEVTLELLDIKTSEGVIQIKQDPKAKSHATFFGVLHIERDVDILIRLPHAYQNALAIKTLSGDLSLGHLGLRSFEFTSTSGSVEAGEMVVGNSVFKTVSGDIKVMDYYGGLLFSTISGDVDISLKALEYDVDGKTISGDVALYVPADGEFGLYLRTRSGDLECAFPLTMLGGNMKNKLRGKVVDDKETINIETTSGDIDIRKYNRKA